MLSAAADRVGSRVVADVKRVCLLGAESTGKSTLARALATRYGTRGTPSTVGPLRRSDDPRRRRGPSWEFTHIARIHCWYEDFLATMANRVLFADTDAFTTAVFHEVYLGTPATGFEDLVDRPYELFVVCGSTSGGVTTASASSRSSDDGCRRYLERARTSGCRWLVVEGPLERRVEEAAGAVDEVLAVDQASG